MTRRPILLLCLLALSSCPAYAQQAVPPDLQRSEDALDSKERQQKLAELQQAAASPQVFLLRKVIVPSSELLSVQELNSVTSHYVNQKVSLADLNRLLDDINLLYKNKGDLAAKAVLPPQRIVNGEVNITLIEGRLGKISVANRTRTRDSYLLNTLQLKPGDVLHFDELQRHIMFLNATTDLQVKALLAPGSSFGTTNVDLQVEQPPWARSMLFFDNEGRESIGTERLGFVQRYSSLFGLRDPLTIGTYWSTGSIDGFISYMTPLGSSGLRFGPSFDYSHMDIVSSSSQASQYGISGTSSDFALKALAPLAVRPHFLMNFNFAAHYKTSRVQSQDVPLTDTEVRSFEVGTDLQTLDHHGVFAVSETLSAGLHSLLGTRPYFKFTTSISRTQTIKGDLIGVLRINGQVNAVNFLPPVEQFQIGGMQTVRGYVEGRQIGDRGYTGSAELQYPMFRSESKWRRRLKGAIFTDTGAVYDSYNSFNRPPGDNRYLTSAGFGFLLNVSRYSGRFDFGVPLRNTAGMPAVGFHFALQANPNMRKVFEAIYRNALY